MRPVEIFWALIVHLCSAGWMVDSFLSGIVQYQYSSVAGPVSSAGLNFEIQSINNGSIFFLVYLMLERMIGTFNQ